MHARRRARRHRRHLQRPWIAITGFQVNFAFTVDHLTLIMLGVVTGVGFLIHLYSVGYMAHEEGYWRFFAYLNLFMFFMLVLVLSAEASCCSSSAGKASASPPTCSSASTSRRTPPPTPAKKPSSSTASATSASCSRCSCSSPHFGSLELRQRLRQHRASTPSGSGGFLTAIALLLVLGAAGKSAQIPLYVWLPDAMEGPTPVSALIHAATMVTAGIYMVARCHVLFDRAPYASRVVAVIGAATAIFAASIGMVQHDIKRVLAYSTVSQLGYMFLACGVGAYSAGIFHLMTHAFFKALLFLAAGSVIHALTGEQDMRKMGGLRKRIPITFWTMTDGRLRHRRHPAAGGLLLQRRNPLPGLHLATTRIGKLLWLVGLVTAGMTSSTCSASGSRPSSAHRASTSTRTCMTMAQPSTPRPAHTQSWSPNTTKARPRTPTASTNRRGS